MALEISDLHRNEEKVWDEYVYNHSGSTFYHQIGWKKVVEETYRHKPIYLVGKEDGEIKGILPLFLMKSRIFGTKLVSIPFGPYGGTCADNKMIENRLLEEARRLTVDNDANYLELRVFSGNHETLFINSSYIASILKLHNDPNVLLMERFNRNKRKTIYKSQKRGLTAHWTSDLPTEFYQIYSKNMKNLGSPPHSIKFFRNIMNEFPSTSKILTVCRKGGTLYVAFYLFYKDIVINTWSSTLDEYRKWYPTDFGIWNAIKYSCEKGYKYYDFGRSSKNSPNLEFKRRWGAEQTPLNYQYQLNNTREVPDFTMENPKRQRFAKAWKKAPLSFTNLVGPRIRASFP